MRISAACMADTPAAWLAFNAVFGYHMRIIRAKVRDRQLATGNEYLKRCIIHKEPLEFHAAAVEMYLDHRRTLQRLGTTVFDDPRDTVAGIVPSDIKMDKILNCPPAILKFEPPWATIRKCGNLHLCPWCRFRALRTRLAGTGWEPSTQVFSLSRVYELVHMRSLPVVAREMTRSRRELKAELSSTDYLRFINITPQARKFMLLETFISTQPVEHVGWVSATQSASEAVKQAYGYPREVFECSVETVKYLTCSLNIRTYADGFSTR